MGLAEEGNIQGTQHYKKLYGNLIISKHIMSYTLILFAENKPQQGTYMAEKPTCYPIPPLG